jgi:hypothetical protein
MSGYIGREPLSEAVQSKAKYTATSGQTTFSFAYQPGFIDVYLNGIKLEDTTDYVATNGSDIVLTTGAIAGQVLEITGLTTYSLINGKVNYSATAAPAVGDDSADGYRIGSMWIDVTNDEVYRCVDDTVGAAVWIKSTLEVAEADLRYMKLSGGGSLTGTSSSPLRLVNTTAATDGTAVGIDFRMNHSGGSTVVAGIIQAESDATWSATSGTRDGSIVIKAVTDGSNVERLRINSAGINVIGDLSNTAISWAGNFKQNANPNSTDPFGVGIKLKLGAESEVDTKWGGIASVSESTYGNSSGLALYANEAERMRITSTGNVVHQGVGGVEVFYAHGYAAGNNYWDVTVPVKNDTGTGTFFHIEACFTHQVHPGHGCMLESWESSRTGCCHTKSEIMRKDSTNAGNWSTTRVSGTEFKVKHNAGTYAGNGPWWVRVTYRRT